MYSNDPWANAGEVIGTLIYASFKITIMVFIIWVLAKYVGCIG